MIAVSLGLTAGELRAEDLTVDKYVELSVARLQLVREHWDQQGRRPDAEDMEPLWHEYGTTAEEYLGFRAKHRSEVASYLEANPSIEATIEQLAAEIKAFVAARESE